MFVPFLAYEASAGSGKTFNLVVRYLSLLFSGVEPHKILALTFTNKAASEMSERIVLTLKTLPTKGELKEIAKVTQQSEETILDARQNVLAKFLNSDTKIMTIDKFFSQILRKFSLYAGIMPDFTTYESQHKVKLLIRFLNEVSIARADESLVNMSLYFSKRVEDINLLLDELYQKRFEISHLKYEKIDFTPFELKIFEILKELHVMLENSPTASKTAKSAFDVESIEDLLKKSYLERDTLNYRTFSKCFTPELDEKFFELKEMLKDYFRAKESSFFHSLFKLLELYTSAKHTLAKNDSELSFDDVSSLCYYLLKQRVDSEFIYFRLDAKIDHILLDEFQDTSLVQFDILKPLIDELSSGVGVSEDKSLFFVGDVKQSIYRFRGGRQELFQNVASRYGVEVKQLKVNYRSSKEVVEFVNRVFKSKIVSYIPQHVTNEGGYVDVITTDDLLVSMYQKVKFLQEKGVDVNEIAILCATNGDGVKISNFLKEQNIDVITETSTKLISQKSVMALCEYLKYCYFAKEIYARNFFALISKEYEEKLVRFSTNNLQQCAQNIINKYELFDGDLNILKFIEILDGYSDIVEFIYEYERLSEGAIKAQLRGVKVLTIHKSKGLEFEHVILLDRLSNPPASRQSIIYEYDGLKLNNLFLRFKARKEVDESYANALAKESQLSTIDNINALYVALTRAKFSLQIVQKSKNSSFDILSLDSYTTPEFKYEPEPLHVEKKEPFIHYDLISYGVQNELIKQDSEVEDDYYAQDYGTALHYVLEMMQNFEQSEVKPSITSAKNRYSDRLHVDDFLSIEKRVKRVIEDKQFKTLTNGNILKEQPISYKNELRYIDLLVKKDNQYIVIDYKSSYAFTDKHKKQVRFYKEAIKSITALHVKAYICYILEDEIKFVEVK